MTGLQLVEFNLLKSFVNICNELELTYYLVCGSALGAVKYGGFIPWDDDIDIALPRSDYELFCKKAPELLPTGYFLQNHKTDKLYPRMYSKLRDSCTTYVEKTTRNLQINHGAFIDIFPLDGYPSDEKEIRKFELRKKMLKLKIECVFDVNYGFVRNAFFAMERLFGFHKNTFKSVEQLEKLVSSYSTDISKLWCNHGNWQGKLEYASREQYGKGILMKFEDFDVRVPEKYDEYLTQKYGDWRQDPPDEERVGHHYYEICDLERPYTEYINANKKC